MRFPALLFALPLPTLAAETLPSPAGSLLQMLLGLGATLGVLIGCLFLLKKLQRGRNAQVGNIQVLGATAVGTREKVVMLSVGKKILVLGVTSNQINLLHTMTEEELPAKPVAAPTAIGSEFAQRLKQMLERRHEN